MMYYKNISLALLLALTSYTADAQHLKRDKIHFGFIYPLSTNGIDAPADTNHLSIHAIAGVSAAEDGVSIAGISNVVKGYAKGVQVAGFSNHIGAESKGLLIAGFSNTYKHADGLQFAGFTNISAGKVRGAQFAGFLNTSKGNTGAQFAGFTNVSKGVAGSQFAGFANIVKDTITGHQIAGFINTADSVGSQFAGFINVARKVKGVQAAGFINIADSSDFPIGIINIIKSGEKSLSFSMDDQLNTLASFRSGGRILYGIIGLGYNLENKDEVYAFELGFGAHFFRTRYFRLNVELSSLCLESFKAGEYFKNSLKALPAIKISKRIELYGGASINYVNTNTPEGRNLTKSYIHSWNADYSRNFNGLYLGYTGGINFIF